MQKQSLVRTIRDKLRKEV
jgi:Ca2+-binding EF-hand superfamily protein